MAIQFKTVKTFQGAGSKLIFRFIEEFQKTFRQHIVVYARHRLPDKSVGGFEHAFYYGEQQTKTFVTTALAKICNYNLLQEYSVERRKPTSKTRSESGKGKVDYWLRFGDSTKISLLVEIKQAWIQYFSKEHWTIYANGPKRHAAAVKQLKDIKDKRDYTIDHLYGLAMTILPIYSRYGSGTDPLVKLQSKVLSAVAEEARTKSNADAYGAFVFPAEVAPIDTWDNEDGQIHENHPGLVLLWSMNKFTNK